MTIYIRQSFTGSGIGVGDWNVPLTVPRGITNIDVDNNIYAGQQSVTINVTGLDIDPATKSVMINGISMPITFWNGVAIEAAVSALDSYYLPTQLQFISWDFPNVVATDIDVDYKMTGYDWFNRSLAWTVDSGPAGMTISANGTIHWTPTSEGAQAVTIGLTFDGVDKITKTFTINVDDSRCIFIATDGSDVASGTSVAPYASLERAATAMEGVTTAFTIYHRGGTYTKNAWNWVDGGAMWELASKDWLVDDPMCIRNYPSESVHYAVTGDGFRTYGNHIATLGIEVSGVTNTETGGIMVFGDSVAKLCIAHDTDFPTNNNCTGFKTDGGAILDSCTAYANYDRSNPTFHNNSNFLHYTDNRVGEGFIIDCISDSLGARTTGTGFKIKHAGNSVVHYHNCIDIGSIRPFGGMNDKASVRNCMLYTDSGSAALSLSITDYSGFNNGAMLIADNIIVSSGYTLTIADGAMYGTELLPVKFLNNDIESTGNLRGSTYLRGEYTPDADIEYVDFSNNHVYSAFPSNAVSLDLIGSDISTLMAMGSNNTSEASLRTHTKTVNGRTFQISNGVGSEI